MDQQFIAGVTAGFFIIIECYLLYHVIRLFRNPRTPNNHTSSLQRILKWISYILAIVIFVGSGIIFWYTGGPMDDSKITRAQSFVCMSSSSSSEKNLLECGTELSKVVDDSFKCKTIPYTTEEKLFLLKCDSSAKLNYFIYEENSKWQIVIVYVVEALLILLFTSFIRTNSRTVPLAVVRAYICLSLTLVVVVYNLFLFFTDIRNPENYSSLGFGALGIFITIFIAILTFKDQEESLNQ